MNSLLRQKEGKNGEDMAVLFLKGQGWIIIDRNFRIRGGEIDIIAIETDPYTEEKTLVFVEVKTRTSQEYGSPLEAIGYYKIKTLLKATQFYKMKHPKTPDLMRIDAVSVLLNEEGQLLDIELVKNITG